MITHTWTVEKLETSPLLAGFENVVRKVFWVLTSTDGTTTVSTKGETELSFDPTNANFLDYSTLTEQQVLGWVANELSQEYLTGLEQANERIIRNTPSPEIVEIPLPWASN